MSPDGFVGLLRLIFAVAAVLLLLRYVVYPVWKLLRQQPDQELLIPDYTKMVEEMEELEVPTADGPQPYERGQAVKAAKADPRATALQVQRWLRQKK